MKLFILSTLIYIFFIPSFSAEHKKYKKEDFEIIKAKKIEYLNKKLNCVNNSQNFRQMKRCWKNNKQKIK